MSQSRGSCHLGAGKRMGNKSGNAGPKASQHSRTSRVDSEGGICLTETFDITRSFPLPYAVGIHPRGYEPLTFGSGVRRALQLYHGDVREAPFP